MAQCPPCPGQGMQWKWVGNGWVPVAPDFGSNGCSPPAMRQTSSLRNRKVEIVLWSFIIFLLIIIGILSYSHLQLLTSVHSLNSETKETTISPDHGVGHIPPMAHRPGASPISLVKSS